MTLTSFCVKSGADTGTSPYQRLKRSRSELSTRETIRDLSDNGSVTSLIPTDGTGSSGGDGGGNRRSNSGNSSSSNSSRESRNGCPSPWRSSCPLPRAGSFHGRRPDVIDSDNTIVLPVGVLGDSETGKTSFLTKYAGNAVSKEYKRTAGVFSTEKVFRIHNTRIAIHIQELGGHFQSSLHLPAVCKDSAAILIMFDLTKRSTLHSVKDWFLQARQFNKVSIPVIIGNKYDQFVQLPRDMQLAIIRQARFYAQVMGASLFFSSITHDINVNKIFKVIVAKLFDLPCKITRNANVGEPIIEY